MRWNNDVEPDRARDHAERSSRHRPLHGAHRHGMVRPLSHPVGPVGLAEEGVRGHRADTVSTASAVVELWRSVSADALLADVSQHRVLLRMRYGWTGVLLLTGRICVRPLAIQGARRVIRRLSGHP